MTTLAGRQCPSYCYREWGSFADGQGSDAWFLNPSAVAVDTRGFVYVADQWNHKIRLVTPTGMYCYLVKLTPRTHNMYLSIFIAY